jgi:hypothetical protein
MASPAPMLAAQRANGHMRIGYGHAAQLIDMMERAGSTGMLTVRARAKC